jgi:hypothetical protein
MTLASGALHSCAATCTCVPPRAWLQLKESVGLSKASSDADLDAATGKLGELEKEVKLLKAVLETANKAATTALSAARKQALEVIKALSDKTCRGTDGEFVPKYAHVHDYLDGTLPEKLQEAFAKAVVAPIDEWLAELAAARADVKEAAQKRCVGCVTAAAPQLAPAACAREAPVWRRRPHSPPHSNPTPALRSLQRRV